MMRIGVRNEAERGGGRGGLNPIHAAKNDIQAEAVGGPTSPKP